MYDWSDLVNFFHFSSPSLNVTLICPVIILSQFSGRDTPSFRVLFVLSFPFACPFWIIDDHSYVSNPIPWAILLTSTYTQVQSAGWLQTEYSLVLIVFLLIQSSTLHSETPHSALLTLLQPSALRPGQCNNPPSNTHLPSPCNKCNFSERRIFMCQWLSFFSLEDNYDYCAKWLLVRPSRGENMW
jgi:hypothetical protein